MINFYFIANAPSIDNKQLDYNLIRRCLGLGDGYHHWIMMIRTYIIGLIPNAFRSKAVKRLNYSRYNDMVTIVIID